MFASLDVTSANLQAILRVEDLYEEGIALEGFSTDSAITSDGVDMTESRRGVDGHIVSGVIKNVIPVTVTLEPQSPTLVSFETLRDAMQTNNKPYECNLTVEYPSIGKKIYYNHGVLQSAPFMTNAQRTLQPTQWVFVFESASFQ